MQILDGNMTVSTDIHLAFLETAEQKEQRLQSRTAESPAPLESKAVGKPSEKGTVSTPRNKWDMKFTASILKKLKHITWYSEKLLRY